MICQGCTPTILYCCSDSITIGLPPNPLADYLLKIEDVTNGRLLILPVQNDGLSMTIDVTDFQFAVNHSYEFTLHLVGDINTPVDFTLMDTTTEVECLSVRFQKPMTQDDEIYYMTNQTVAA